MERNLLVIALCSLPPANEVWSKVLFLHQFVILFTGGEQYLTRYPSRRPGTSPLAGIPPLAGTPPLPGRYTTPLAGTPPSRYPPWQVHHPPWQVPPGRYTPLAGTPPPPPPPRMLLCAGGTHPTGMHSCLN